MLFVLWYVRTAVEQWTVLSRVAVFCLTSQPDAIERESPSGRNFLAGTLILLLWFLYKVLVGHKNLKKVLYKLKKAESATRIVFYVIVNMTPAFKVARKDFDTLETAGGRHDLAHGYIPASHKYAKAKI